MGLAQTIKAHYANKNHPRFARQIVLPAADPGLGVTLTASDAAECTYGLWEAIAAYTTVLVPSIITGVVFDTPHDVGTLPIVYTVDIGLTYIVLINHNYQTAAATKTAEGNNEITHAQIHRASVRLEIVSAAGSLEPVMLPFPVWVPADVGILGRVKTDSEGGSADQINVSVLLLQHFELPWE